MRFISIPLIFSGLLIQRLCFLMGLALMFSLLRAAGPEPEMAVIALSGTVRSDSYYDFYLGDLSIAGYDANCDGSTMDEATAEVAVGEPVPFAIYTYECGGDSDIKIKSCNRLYIKNASTFSGSVEWLSRSVSKTKQGWGAYVNGLMYQAGYEVDYRRFRIITIEGGIDLDFSCNAPDTGYVLFSVSGQIRRDEHTGDVIEDTTHGYWSRLWCSEEEPDECSGSVSLASYGRAPDGFGIHCSEGGTPPASTGGTWSNQSGLTSTFSSNGNATGSSTATVSDEYTTAQLITNTTSALPDWGDNWGGIPGSYRNLAPTEFTHSIRESRYRIRYTPSGSSGDSPMTLKWVERFVPEAGVPITSVEVVDGGYGYTTPPSVVIGAPGSGGTQAQAIATVANGKITSVTLTNPGSGYKLGTHSASLSGGDGSGAVMLLHYGTETEKSAILSSNPPNYDPYDYSTYPFIGPINLAIPEENGTTLVANIHIVPSEWKPLDQAAQYQLQTKGGEWLLMAMPAGGTSGAGDPDATLGSVDFKVDLGSSPSGYSYGKLQVHIDTINSAASLRSQWALSTMILAADEVVQISDVGGLRQIVSPAGLIDLQDASGGCDIRFYTSSDYDPLDSGLHPIKSGAVPYVTYEVRDATVASVSKLLIRELRPSGTGKYHLYGQQTGEVWSLEQGTFGAGSILEPTNRTTRTPVTIAGQPAYSFMEEDFTYSPGPRTTTRRTFTKDAAAPYTSQDQSIDYPEGRRVTYDYIAGYYNSSSGGFTAYEWGSDLLTTETVGRAFVAPELWVGHSTRTATITNYDGRTLQRTLSVYNGTDFIDTEQTRYSYDGQGHLIMLKRNGQTTYSAQWADDFKDWEIDEAGVKTTYAPWPDGTYMTTSGKQPVMSEVKTAVGSYGTYPAQSAITTTYYYSPDGNGDVYVSAEEKSGGGLTLLTAYAQDTEGRPTYTEFNGLHTSYAYETLAGGGLRTTVTQPSGATEIREEDADGRTLCVSGTGVTAEYHTYTQDVDGNDVRTTYYGSSTAATANYLTVVTDANGRRLRELRPAYLTATTAGVNERRFYYDITGQLVRVTTTGMADMLYVYNDLGELWRSGYDMDGDGQLMLASADKLQQTETTYQQDGTDWYRVTTTQIPYTPNSATLTTVAQTKERLTLPSGTLRETISINEAGVETHMTTTINLTQALVEESTTISGTTGTSLSVTRNGLLQAEQTNTQTAPTLYGYDGLGRLGTITPADGPVTVYAYNGDGLLQSTTRHSPDNTQTWVETLTYHSQGSLGAGQVATRTTAGRITNYAYGMRGKLLRQWGATYPVRFTYDAFGRVETMHTYRAVDFDLSEASWPAGDITTWAYHPATGQLITKMDAATQPVNYAYYASGLLFTRTWARGLVTTYGYTDAGELTSMDYSDDTPAVGITYDRAGRPLAITDAAGTLTRTYESGALTDEIYTGTGLLSGRTIERVLGPYGRLSNLTTDAGYSLGYTYDDAGRLDELTQGTHLAKYSYRPNVGGVETVTIKRQGVDRTINEYQPDGLGRLETVRMTTGSVVPVERGYHYNAASQRDRVTHEDTRLWAYGYDDFGQVNTAEKRLADAVTPLPGYGFGYDFDQMGNRETTTVNGRSASYMANQLNQIDSRQVPGAVDVRGVAQATATVTVDTQSTTRTDKDYYREVALDNSTEAAKARLNIEATDGIQTVTETRLAFLPQTPESYTYDLDGNLTQDGRWDYTWDAENRLVKMETCPAVASAAGIVRQRLTFAYDAQGRRIRKNVELFNPTTSAWIQTADTKFIYDGWNLLAEHRWDPNTSTYDLAASYVWGLDLSGTLQGAGGVGGLLWASLDTQTFATSSDASGNVIAYINTETQAVAGRLDCSAFGEPVVRTGVAGRIPYGFSSKYTDIETGFMYYGFRYYNPSTGRWLSRDLIEERGGVNLYGVVNNNPVNSIDLNGLYGLGVESLYIEAPRGENSPSLLHNGRISTELLAVLGMHYLGGGSYTLSEKVVKSIHMAPLFDFDLFKVAKDKFISAKASGAKGFRVTEGDNAEVYGFTGYSDIAAVVNLLGHFRIRMTGSGGQKSVSGKCEWWFSGQFQIVDVFQYDPELGPKSSGAAPFLNKAGQFTDAIVDYITLGSAKTGPVDIKSEWVRFEQKIEPWSPAKYK